MGYTRKGLSPSRPAPEPTEAPPPSDDAALRSAMRLEPAPAAPTVRIRPAAEKKAPPPQTPRPNTWSPQQANRVWGESEKLLKPEAKFGDSPAPTPVKTAGQVKDPQYWSDLRGEEGGFMGGPLGPSRDPMGKALKRGAQRKRERLWLTENSSALERDAAGFPIEPAPGHWLYQEWADVINPPPVVDVPDVRAPLPDLPVTSYEGKLEAQKGRHEQVAEWMGEGVPMEEIRRRVSAGDLKREEEFPLGPSSMKSADAGTE